MKMVMTKLVILEKPRAHAIGMEKQLYIMQQGVVISRFASFFLAMFKRKIQKMSMGRLQLIMHLSTDIWISCIFVNSYQRPFAQKENENKTRDFWRPKFEKCFRQTIWISRTTSTSESWVSSKTSYPCATFSSTSESWVSSKISNPCATSSCRKMKTYTMNRQLCPRERPLGKTPEVPSFFWFDSF